MKTSASTDETQGVFSMKYNTQKLYDLPEGNRQEDAPRRVAKKKRRRR